MASMPWKMPAVSSWVHAQVDFGYFGPPEEHLLWTEEEREATYITPEDPSSEIAGEVAAAFAATAIAFNETGVYAPAPSIQQSQAARHAAMTPAVDRAGANIIFLCGAQLTHSTQPDFWLCCCVVCRPRILQETDQTRQANAGLWAGSPRVLHAEQAGWSQGPQQALP